MRKSFVNKVFKLLKMIGARRGELINLVLLRLLIFGLLSWLLGWSIGFASAQMAFRLAAYIFKGPYAVPTLSLIDLMYLLLWTLTVVFAGGIWPLLIPLKKLGALSWSSQYPRPLSTQLSPLGRIALGKYRKVSRLKRELVALHSQNMKNAPLLSHFWFSYSL